MKSDAATRAFEAWERADTLQEELRRRMENTPEGRAWQDARANQRRLLRQLTTIRQEGR